MVGWQVLILLIPNYQVRKRWDWVKRGEQEADLEACFKFFKHMHKLPESRVESENELTREKEVSLATWEAMGEQPEPFLVYSQSSPPSIQGHDFIVFSLSSLLFPVFISDLSPHRQQEENESWYRCSLPLTLFTCIFHWILDPTLSVPVYFL